MKLSEELQWRGFINQTTLSNIKDLDNKIWTFYHGFDVSSDSQTIGNLAAMMLDRCFIRQGNKAVLLIGGATSLIGDPGGKDSERTLQSESVIARNCLATKVQIKGLFRGLKFQIVNNLDWTKKLTIIDFLRDVGKHFSMTSLVQRDYIARRLGKDGAGISYAEFSYTVLQGMDFLYLYDNYQCTLQLGGSDQWGNCLSGVDLIRRTRNVETHVLTLPLITNKTTGKKFGKSEEGTVWLSAKKTSIYKFYQFWLNCDDEGVESYLKVFTELDKKSIDDIMKRFSQNRTERLAQKTLAFEVTKLVHGEQQAINQKQIAKAITDQDLVSLDESKLATIREEMPSIKVKAPTSMVKLLVDSGLANSNSQARQLLTQGAVYINAKPIDKESIEVNDFINKRLLIRRGKALKDTALVELIK